MSIGKSYLGDSTDDLKDFLGNVMVRLLRLCFLLAELGLP